MTQTASNILVEALQLSPVEKAELVENILASFSFADRKVIDDLWAAEAEDRINAYEKGEIKARPVSEVFDRIERNDLA